MDASVCIEQEGIVEEVINHNIRVRIHRDSVCGHCTAQSICNLSGDSESIIDIGDKAMDLKTGDIVGITIARNMGHKAVLLGYLLPFLILMGVLILLNSLGMKEWLSGLISLAALIPYYFILYLYRDRLRKSFAFTVRKKEL
jgi:sigma-E factor negative regulatory protein RseC